MNTKEHADQTVLLPVSLRHVHQVAEYAAGLAAAGGKTTSQRAPGSAVGETVTVPGQGDWTESMIGELVDSISYEAVLSLLDACAGSAGEWVAKAEVEEAEGFSAIQLRNELGALSKRTIKLFGQALWPMEWKKERGTYSYRMNGVVASWWTAARQGR